MTETWRTIEVDSPDSGRDLATARGCADAVAADLLDDPVCLSWVDTATGRESPAHASECHGDCDIPGAVEYALNRGAELKVVVDDGRFIFCYRALGEFADS
jgi:hypothetical protein